MKKIFSLVMAVLICVSLACPVFADTFTPSVSYKGSPEVVDADLEDENVKDCIVVTSVQEAKKKTTDITQEERDLLLEVYSKLSDGSMKVPGLKEGYVIRDLVDISFEYEDCRQKPDHGQKDQQLKKEGVTLELVLDLNVGKLMDVVVMTYIDGEWKPIESVKNNGNGTVTCVFEDICPVIFAVQEKALNGIPQTGDVAGQKLMLWVGVMASAAVALVAVVTISRKRK